MDQGVEMIPLGLYMIKGDNVYVWLGISLLVCGQEVLEAE